MEDILPAVETGEKLDFKSIKAVEKFTKPAPRYVEASLVKKLEELGIGRPSTYAPTISTIQKRGYVEKVEREGTKRNYKVLELKNNNITKETQSEITGKDRNKLTPTDIGIVVNDFLVEHFGKILDYHFTAKVEQEFDEIAQGLKDWTKMIHDFYSPFHANVEQTLEHSERASGEKELGIDPTSGKKVIVRIGRYGPMAQIGDSEQKDVQFASLRPNQSLNSITLEEALDLFKLPRTLGEFEGKVVKSNVGRFGPYVQHDGKFISLKTDDPMQISLTRAIELIEEKREDDAQKVIKTFEEKPDVQLLNGRWGPYLKIGKNNFKLPKGTEAEKLTLEECLHIADNQPKKTFKKKGK
jgi:DNA topoisomerase-1